MGPCLLMDKSAIQALPKRLLPALSRHYYLNIPPILVTEILGDLTKASQGGPTWMRMLAERLHRVQHYVNLDHRELRLESLLGHHVTMDGRPAVGIREFETSVGPSAMVTETPHGAQLFRWRHSSPSPDDEASAAEWRGAIASINLEQTKVSLKAKFGALLQRVSDFRELGLLVNSVCSLGDQGILLEMVLEDAQIESDARGRIRERWKQERPTSVNAFAPYAFFCFRVRLLFHLGLINDLVTTRSTNTADLIYFYYAPFSRVFCSNDKLHKDLAPLILGPDQEFIPFHALRPI